MKNVNFLFVLQVCHSSTCIKNVASLSWWTLTSHFRHSWWSSETIDSSGQRRSVRGDVFKLTFVYTLQTFYTYAMLILCQNYTGELQLYFYITHYRSCLTFCVIPLKMGYNLTFQHCVGYVSLRALAWWGLKSSDWYEGAGFEELKD